MGPLLRPSKRLLTAAAAAVVDRLQDSLLRRLPLGHPARWCLQGVVRDEQVLSVQTGRAMKFGIPCLGGGSCCRGRARHRGNAKLEQLRQSRNSRYRAGTTLSQNGYGEGSVVKIKSLLRGRGPHQEPAPNNSGTISEYLPDDPTLPWIMNVGLGRPSKPWQGICCHRSTETIKLGDRR